MAAPVPEVFERRDLWTEAEFLALPVDRRLELLDGALLVSPSARLRHQRLSSRLWAALNAAIQPLVLSEPIGITLDLAELAATTRPPG
jgi:Putative restriction endonuclease